MKKIFKVLGTIRVVGSTMLAGTVLYHKGYEKGYNKALRDSDDDYFSDNDEDFEEEENSLYSDDFREGLGFSHTEFLDAVNVIKECRRASAWLLKERMNISYDKAKALIQYFMDIGYIGMIRQAPHNSFEVYIDEEFNA